MTPSSLPETNTSLCYTHPSSPPHLVHPPLTPPGPNELLIKVHAASINPVDIQLWGNPVLGWLAGSKEKGIGRDYAGEVVGVGAGLEGKWKEGDEVFGLFSQPAGDGTFAQYLKVTAQDPIARKPRCWSWHEAAAVPLVALTAFACLDWLPAPSAAQGADRRRVVVCGASGGVGVWCVQLAKKLYNCHVVGVCSGRNAEFVRSMGADEVLDYTREDVPRRLVEGMPGGRKYDLYVDCVGGVGMFKHWHDLLHKNGAYVTIVGDKTARTSMGGPATYFTHPAQVFRYLYGYFFGPRYANVLLYQRSDLLEKTADLAEKGEVRVIVQEVVDGVLDEKGYTEAWERVKGTMVEGRVRGKVVVNIKH